METVTIFAVLATVAGSAMAFSNIFQAIKIFRRKSAADVSKLTYIIITIGAFIWILYGIEISNLPIIISNGFGFIVTIITLVGCALYGNSKHNQQNI